MTFVVEIGIGADTYTLTERSPFVTVTDGATTNGHFTVTSATAGFTPLDYGTAISGAGIPAGAYIDEYTSPTTVQISDAATATATGVTLTFERPTVVTDGIHFLSGLDFGWDIPTNGIWPAQPNPMTCSVAINVPDFSAVATFFNEGLGILEGDVLSVEVKSDSEGDIIARFYGNITDIQASPRPVRSGVTLSLVAVDPMAGLNELSGVPYPSGTFPDFREENIVSELWGSFGGAPDVSDLWTTPERFIYPDSIEFARPVNTLTVVNGILLQAVDLAGKTRMIVSPNIDAIGAIHSDPISGRSFTLDTVSSDVLDFGTTVFSAGAVRLSSLKWAAAKGFNPGTIFATGFAGGVGTVFAEVAGATSDTHQTIQVTSNDSDEAQDTVDFYAATGFDQWQLDRITLVVTRAGIGEAIPANFFPNWKADEGDPARGACYSRLVTITDVDTTRTPDGADEIVGVLTGARCHVAGGELELVLTIRRPHLGSD